MSENGRTQNGSRSPLRAIVAEISRHEPLDLVLILTLILLIVRPGPAERWYLEIPLTIIAVSPLLAPSLLRNACFWGLLTALLLVVHVGLHYHTSDNHKFLLTYWCLALTGALTLRDPQAALALNGRLIIGIVFLLAAAWKLTSASYVNDDTFYFLLLTDSRFFSLAYLLGGMPWETFAANQESIGTLNSLPETIPLTGTAALPAVAKFLSWWTVLIEGTIAILFLIPRGEKIALGRHLTLLLFLASTYPPTSVIQFGWIVIIMAIASTPPEAKRIRLAYVVTFFFLFCFSTGYVREQFYEWVRTG